jgi:hypothetical protein
LPLWVSLETVGAREGDRTVQSLQGRVAVARLERDLRLASAKGCPFTVTAPVLEASASQIVFLETPATGSSLLVFEWEIVGGALMRRWALCPAIRPAVYKHSLFRDNKTMLEGVEGGGAFAYVVDGAVVAGPIAQSDLPRIEGVVLGLQVGDEMGKGTSEVGTTARVSR